MGKKVNVLDAKLDNTHTHTELSVIFYKLKCGEGGPRFAVVIFLAVVVSLSPH